MGAEKYIMEVPGWLLKSVKLGKAFVDGATIKDATTKQVLAHLQGSGGLETAMAGPVGMVMQAGKLVSSIAANVQLEQVKSALSTLQVVAGVGAAASVLNLGVSVAGFALVLHRLKAVQQQLHDLSDKIDSVKAQANRLQLAKAITTLQRCDDAFGGSAERRPGVWADEERVLQEHIVYMVLELFGDDATALTGSSRACWPAKTLSADEMALALAWPLLCLNMRVQTLLLLRDPQTAQRACQQASIWLGRLVPDQAEYVLKHADGKPIGPKRRDVLAGEAEEVGTLVLRAQAEAMSRASLCQTLAERKLDSRKYIEAARDQSRPAVLMLPAADLSAYQGA